MQACHDQTLERGRAEYLTNELSGIRGSCLLKWKIAHQGMVSHKVWTHAAHCLSYKRTRMSMGGAHQLNITKLPTAMQLHEGPYYLV